MKKRAVPCGHVCIVLLILAGSLLCSGCASIVSKSIYEVQVNSNPSGANYSIMDHEGQVIKIGTTPDVVPLKAGRGWFQAGDYAIVLSKPGCNSHSMQIKQNLDPWYLFGNILIGGLVGWVIVDPITGAMWTIEDVHATLDCEQSLSDSDVHQSNILRLDEVPETLHSQMVRIN